MNKKLIWVKVQQISTILPSFCSINDDQLKLEDAPLCKETLENNKSYLLDCGAEVFLWVGRVTSVEDRKAASQVAEVYLHSNFVMRNFIERRRLVSATFDQGIHCEPRKTKVNTCYSSNSGL